MSKKFTSAEISYEARVRHLERKLDQAKKQIRLVENPGERQALSQAAAGTQAALMELDPVAMARDADGVRGVERLRRVGVAAVSEVQMLAAPSVPEPEPAPDSKAKGRKKS